VTELTMRLKPSLLSVRWLSWGTLIIPAPKELIFCQAQKGNGSLLWLPSEPHC